MAKAKKLEEDKASVGQTPNGRETDGRDSNAGRLGETSMWGQGEMQC